MNKLIFPDYNRAPSSSLQKILREGEFLAPLIALHGKQKGEYDLALDVQLRRSDEVHVYYGLTKLVTAQLKKNDKVKISAAKTYEDHDDKNFFRDWYVGETGFQDCLNDYLNIVIGNVARTWIAKEGRVQAIWAQVAMPHGPWTPFDREAVLDFSKLQNAKKKAEKFRKFSEVGDAQSRLERMGKRWSKLPKPGVKPDQLAIDGDGNLILVENKYAGKRYDSSKLYYTPLQLLQYIHEWNKALERSSVWDSLQELIDIKMDLGLSRDIGKRLTGGIRAVICFGEDERSDEVKRRFCEVLNVVNEHLPPNVQSVETWGYSKNGPQPL